LFRIASSKKVFIFALEWILRLEVKKTLARAGLFDASELLVIGWRWRAARKTEVPPLPE